MPQIADAPYVVDAATAPEFLAQIEIAAGTRVEPAVVDAFLEQRTWCARAKSLLELANAVLRAPASKDAPSMGGIADSLKRDEPVSAAQWQELYPRLLEFEKQLETTQAWARSLQAAELARQRERARWEPMAPLRWAQRVRGWFKR